MAVLLTSLMRLRVEQTLDLSEQAYQRLASGLRHRRHPFRLLPMQSAEDVIAGGSPDPAHFDELAARTSAMVHEFPGWTDELRAMEVPTMRMFGDRDFSPLPDIVEMFELLPNAQLAVLPGTTHVGITRRPGEVLALITPFLDPS
jgi:pimeloyl-ACP methyl ester carboxylesterase